MDIFISYKNDGISEHFGPRLKKDLENVGYSVYFASHESKLGEFPTQLQDAIKSSSCVIILLTDICLNYLKENNKIDWVREELVTAKENDIPIIPILLNNTHMPKDKNDMPKTLRFLPDTQAITFSTEYTLSPFDTLINNFILFKPGEKRTTTTNPNINTVIQFDETLKNANNGDISSMFAIACYYYFGYTADNSHFTDYEKAYYWLNKISELNKEYSSEANAMIANMYYSGLVPTQPQSFKKSYEYYNKIPQDDNKNFREKLLFMKSQSVGTDFEIDEILSLFDLYKENASNSAKNTMAKFCINYGLFDKALELLESMDGLYPDAEYKLGQLYQFGVHCQPPKPDYYRALSHYENAADAGHTDAIHAIGLLYFRGPNGFKQSLEKARARFKEAALKGHRGGQYDYAYMCLYGLGGEVDVDTAIDYFENSAKLGHVMSMTKLAEICQDKKYGHINYNIAFKWASKAVEANDKNGAFILAGLYLSGLGCDYNLNKALQYYRQAYDTGFFQAKIMVEKIEKILNTKKSEVN